MLDGPSITLTTSVYERLRRDLLKADFAPGEKLRIEALCGRYEVGASPIREALSRLSAEGIVTREDQRGFRVPQVSLEDLRELTDTRCAINELALRRAIARGDSAWEEQVLLAYHRLSRTPVYLPGGTAVSPDWDRRHRVFHNTLIATCGSRWICDFSATLFDLAERYRHLSSTADHHRNFEDEHRAIMEAVISRDADLAVGLLNKHVSRTSEIVALVERWGTPAKET